MSDPITFLLARLDKDEAAARKASVDPVGAMEAHFEAEALHEEQDWTLYPERRTEYSRGQADALHWAATRTREQIKPLTLHDPVRALREVEAGRLIIENCRTLAAMWAPGNDTFRLALERAVIAPRAAVYSDHPDYRQEWKP